MFLKGFKVYLNMSLKYNLLRQNKLTEIICPAKACKHRGILGNCTASKIELEFADEDSYELFDCLTYQRDE